MKNVKLLRQKIFFFHLSIKFFRDEGTTSRFQKI